jgi:hypothetical protein
MVVALVACGDDSGGGGDDQLDSGTGSGGSSSNPMMGGTGGTSTGTGGTSTGTGGAVGTGGTGMLPMPMCDTTMVAETSCGGTACTAPTSPVAAFVCAQTCCLADNTCGTRRATMMNPTACTPPAVLDPDCPDFTSMGMGGMATVYPGCCTPGGVCGVRSTADMTCITSSPLLMGLMPGGPCDGGDAGVEDGG